MNEALGLIEIQGLATAILVADTMVKTANVSILEVERTRGLGWITVKITGDVAAVAAAIQSGRQVGEKYGHLVSSKVIPRPSDGVECTFCRPPCLKQKDGELSVPAPVSAAPAEKAEKEPLASADAQSGESSLPEEVPGEEAASDPGDSVQPAPEGKQAPPEEPKPDAPRAGQSGGEPAPVPSPETGQAAVQAGDESVTAQESPLPAYGLEMQTEDRPAPGKRRKRESASFTQTEEVRKPGRRKKTPAAQTGTEPPAEGPEEKRPGRHKAEATGRDSGSNLHG